MCSHVPGTLPTSQRAQRHQRARRSGLVLVKNPHLDLMEEDVLYHLDLGTKTHNLPAMFGDIKLWGEEPQCPELEQPCIAQCGLLCPAPWQQDQHCPGSCTLTLLLPSASIFSFNM
uniref:Uridine phosphorylase 2 n=1 Tax=Geospiza parvula TaxID=87175 RepID=A0A8C3N3Q3_GEOPR